jgi:hypothetical protein
LPPGVQSTLEHAVLAASVAACLSLAYLLFVLLSGALAHNIIGGSALEGVTRNVGLAKTIFLWSLWIVVVSAMIRHYRSESVAYVTMLLGGTCWIVMPLVVGSRVPETSAQDLVALGHSLVESFQIAGAALLAVGVLRVAVGRVYLVTAISRATTQVTGAGAAGIAAERALERPSLMRRCWELHYCRGSLRGSCPRFLGGVSCWKKGSGCYCDQGLATRLLSEMGASSRAEYAEELKAGQRKAQRLKQRGRRTADGRRKKAPCGECPLYLDHQKHKYRVLSWLSYPAAAAIIGVSLEPLRNGYRWVEYTVGSFLAGMQVLPHALTSRPYQEASWFSAEGAAVVLIGVVLVGIVLHAMEIVVFRFKL